MDDGLDVLATDLSSPDFAHGVEQGFWKLEGQESARLYVWVFAADDRKYLLALDCEDYGREPLGGRFIDGTTHVCVASAWPEGDGPFSGWVKFQGSNPQELFICWNQDRYGIQHHPEWRPHRAWARPNPLCIYLEFIRCLLNNPSRGYRRKPAPA